MASRGFALTLSLLVVAISIHASYAAWQSSFAISNLASGGQVMFITADTKGLYLYKGLNVQPVGGSTVPKPTQNFAAEGSFPDSFKLKVQGKYVAVGSTGVVSLTSAVSGAAVWNKDASYRIKVGASLCLDVQGSAASPSVRLVVKACSSASKVTTQQWNVLPAQSPTKGVTGAIMNLDFNAAVPTPALAETTTLVDSSTPGVYTVALKTFAANTPSMVLSTSSNRTNGGNWNTDVFELKFSGTNRCLMVYCVGCSLGAPRYTATIVSAPCFYEFGDSYYYRWYYNSRGMLQNDAVAGDTGVAICLQTQGTSLVAGDCSFRKWNNRWGFQLSSSSV